MPSALRSGSSTRGRPDRRALLALVVVAWGVQAIVTQSLLLREALVLMFGSELAWGIVLSTWLCGVAVGAAFVGRISDRLGKPELALTLVIVALSVATCVDLWLFRTARGWLGVAPGELLALPKIMLASVICVAPAGVLVGMAFPLACAVGRSSEPRASARAVRRIERPPTSPNDTRKSGAWLGFGEVYALESAGSLVGGAAFSFWAVEHLSPIETALICCALSMGASALFLACFRREPGSSPGAAELRSERGAVRAEARGSGKSERRTSSAWISLGLAILAPAALATSLTVGQSLNRKLVERRWHDIAPGYELCAEVETKYQNLALGRLADQYSLYSDGQVVADFPDPYTLEPLAHFWMCQHPSPKSVLVMGGGAEGLLAEVLRHPVTHVDYVEPDPRLITLIEPYLSDADRRALRDPRVIVRHIDARRFVKMQRHRYDLVIARLPEPLSAVRARMFTDEFYRELRRAMTDRSVLCMTAKAAPGPLRGLSAEYVATLRATLARHFPRVLVGWGDPAHILAATEDGLISTDPAVLMRRYEERDIRGAWFDPTWFEGATDWADPDKLRQRAAQLDEAGQVPISTDLRPVIFLQRLALWESAMNADADAGRARGVIARLRSVSVPTAMALLAAIGGVALLAHWLRSRRRPSGNADAHEGTNRQWFASGAVMLAVGATGFVTMALSLVWLFAFQTLYGFVYQRIGWIIAVFMGGLVIGSLGGSRRWGSSHSDPPAPRRAWTALILVDLSLATLAATVPFILPALASLQSGPAAQFLVEACITILVALTGVLGGATFALAGSLQLDATGRPGAAAGSVVGADHAGACLGALLGGLLFVPVFGIATTAWLLAGLKLSSVGLLLAGRQSARAD